MEASAPSARWVWPRITPGCSSNVRLTRSSKSRMRSIWVNIQIRRSSLSSAVLILGLLSRDAGADLRQRRLVGTVEFLLDRQVAQRLGQDLGAPRPRIAGPVQRARRSPAMSNSPSPGSSRWLMTSSSLSSMYSCCPSDSSTQAMCSAGIVASRSGSMRSLPMCQVSMARPPLGRDGLGDEAQAGLERADVGVERDDLVGDLGVGVVGGVVAQRRVLLDHPVELARGLGDVADLDVVGVEGRRGLEQLAGAGGRTPCAPRCPGA